MKVIVEYNEQMNQITLPDGSLLAVSHGIVFDKPPENDILSLVKSGLSAEDLINLKKADLL